MKIVAKSILYLFLELVLFVAVYSWGNILLGQVGEADACITPEYGEFKLIEIIKIAKRDDNTYK